MRWTDVPSAGAWTFALIVTALHPSSATLKKPDDGHKPRTSSGAAGRSPASIVSATIGVNDTLPVERYLLAFEAGTLPQTDWGPRIRELGAKVIDGQDRRTQLRQQLDATAPAVPS